jgi:hypothetical protein
LIGVPIGISDSGPSEGLHVIIAIFGPYAVISLSAVFVTCIISAIYIREMHYSELLNDLESGFDGDWFDWFLVVAILVSITTVMLFILNVILYELQIISV